MTTQVWWILGGVLGAAYAFGRPRRLQPVLPDEVGPRRSTPNVSVIIPARNEEATLPLLLGDLTATHRPDREIIVVNDHSTDRTGAVARAFPGVTVTDADELPDGWCGKPWACQTGVDAAVADNLVFLDADVRVDSRAVDAIIGELHRSGGLVSVQPRHAVGSVVEHLSALFNVIALAGAGAGNEHPTGAFGPVLATSRTDYDAVGGHAAVRSEIIEDMALAAAYRGTGRKVTVKVGGPLVSFRMYPQGLGQLVEGWTKNFATGAGNTPPLRLVAIVAWVTSLINVTIAVGTAAFGAYDGSLVVLGLASALSLLQFGAMLRVAGTFNLATPLLLPIHVAFFLIVFSRSAFRTLVRRSVTWRGRTIDLRTSARARDLAA